jgi:transcriptional regulator with XRE-family HTH domain
MTLKQYLIEKGLTQGQFAKLSDLTQASISRYLAYKQKPDLEALLKIQRATKGKVDAKDFMNQAGV